MAASLRWDGLDELIHDLQNLPDDLRAEAGGIVQKAGDTTAQTVRAEYQRHRWTGKLADSVVVETLNSGQFGVVVRVRAKARHAHLVERGTQTRHTSSGANRGRIQPGLNVFIPTALRSRRQMYEALKQLLLRHGATRVEGEP